VCVQRLKGRPADRTSGPFGLGRACSTQLIHRSRAGSAPGEYRDSKKGHPLRQSAVRQPDSPLRQLKWPVRTLPATSRIGSSSRRGHPARASAQPPVRPIVQSTARQTKSGTRKPQAACSTKRGRSQHWRELRKARVMASAGCWAPGRAATNRSRVHFQWQPKPASAPECRKRSK
jgi:hypothetical protein